LSRTSSNDRAFCAASACLSCRFVHRLQQGRQLLVFLLRGRKIAGECGNARDAMPALSRRAPV
jgi:hypothetical protein